ncbi:MAG: DUF748 domain-containing protein [Myxococcota bacterium]
MEGIGLQNRSRVWLVLAGFAALVAASLALLAIALPRVVESPEFQTALAARAGEALGTPVEWERLSIGLFPPRVVVESPVLVGQAAQSEATASVRADAIDLRLSLWPLLERRVAVESLVLRGVALTATRTAEGWILPEIARRVAEDARGDGGTSSGAAESDEVEGGDAEATGASGAGSEAFALDLRVLRVEAGSVLVHDRTTDPAVDWQVEGLSATARGASLGDPLDVRASAALRLDERPLGRVSIRGRVDLAGSYALDVDLEDVAIVELQRFARPLALSSGVLSASVTAVAEGASSSPRLEGAVEIDDLALRTRGVDVAGDLVLRARPGNDDAIAFEATFRPEDSGRVEANGVRTDDGKIELTAMLEGFELAPFAPLAGEGRTLAGRATGEVSLLLSGDALNRVDMDLVVDAARYADGRIDARGRLDVALGLEGDGESAPARLQAVFEPEQGGRVDVAGTGTLGGALKGSLRFDALDVALLAPLLPAEARVEGTLTGDLELDVTAEREIARLASRLRIAGARLRRDDVDLAGDLSIDARSEDAGPVDLTAKATLADGGRIAVTGGSSRQGDLDLMLELTRFDLAGLMPFLDTEALALAGRASGRGRVVGPYDDPRSLSLSVEVVEARIALEDALLTGPFTLVLDVDAPLSEARRGRVDLDLSEAVARSGERFVKPAGVRARLSTRFERTGAGAIAFETKGALNDVNALALKGTIGSQTQLALTTSSFDLKGWGLLVPALAPYDPAGMAAFEGFSLTRSEDAPDRFGGRLALRSVDATLPGAGRVRIKGTLDGVGERLDLDVDSASLHGLTVGIDGYVDDPLGDARFQVAVHSIGEAEANTFVSGLANVRNTLFGPLRLDAHLAGIAGGEARLVDSLDGSVRFSVGESGGGRLRGVSLLQMTLGQIPVLGGVARVASRLRAQAGGPDYLAESFEILEGDLAIADGRVEARTLRLRRRGYEARLTGQLQLDGLVLDMKGELLLESPLVAALSGRPAAALAGRGPVRIPLARVTNTLADPKVTLTAETLAAAPALLLMSTGVGAVVDRTIEETTERVGEVRDRVGGAVGDALGRIGRALGGSTDPANRDQPTARGDAPVAVDAPVEAKSAPARPEPPSTEAVPADVAPPIDATEGPAASTSAAGGDSVTANPEPPERAAGSAGEGGDASGAPSPD